MKYEQLHPIVFREGYPGYRPEVRELPNGDGKVDAEKRFAHVALKYLKADTTSPRKDWCVLAAALVKAHALARTVATTLGVPQAFFPDIRYSALRVLEYPAGATSNLHTDFDLFTCMIHRDQPECFVTQEPPRFDISWRWSERLDEARKINAQLHLGELGELLGLGPATPHEVVASESPQHSIVYFAIPNHEAVLPTGVTVGEWLSERMARSRVAISVAQSHSSRVA